MHVPERREDILQYKWYGVRTIFCTDGNHPWGPFDLELGEFAYEERILLWSASSPDEAIHRAECEALDYATEIGARYLGIAQCCELSDKPESGKECFSLIRKSVLEADVYLDRFFDAGTEYQRNWEDDLS